MDLKSCQVIANDKSNLLRKNDFLLESGFQVVVFFILLELGYLIIKIMSDWFIFSDHFTDWFIFSGHFTDWWFNFFMVSQLYYFST